MSAFLPHRLLVTEGWELTLSDQPPAAAPFQIVTVLEGRGRWSRGGREQDLEASVPWWSSGLDQRWSADGQSRWLCLAGDRCPIAGWAEGLDALDTDTPRCCTAVLADVQELAAIVTDCPFPCELKDLLTRGKSLMLVSKTLATLSSLGRPTAERTTVVRFFEADLDRVRQAKALLIETMENPPSVPELARLVGLNELKLKAGFHHLWGTTVYGLLRKERLAEARRFLTAGQGNVGEAAYRVGYTNTSHFAEAFKKEFGVAPGTLMRSRSLA